MRIKQTSAHSNLTKMKKEILPACLEGNYRDSLGESSDSDTGSLNSFGSLPCYVQQYKMLIW